MELRTGQAMPPDIPVFVADRPPGRVFEAYWHFTSWAHVSFGMHADFSLPNIELHLPFGFFRFGWRRKYRAESGVQVLQVTRTK